MNNNYDFSKLGSISYEETYVSPPEEIHKVRTRIDIYSYGNVNFFDGDVNISYKASVADINALFNDLKEGFRKNPDVTFTDDDTSRILSINYDNGYSESLSGLSPLIDLIYEFIGTVD